MARFHLGLLAAFVAIFVVLAHVSTATRTIITTVTVDETGGRESGRCGKQTRAAHCETFLTERAPSTSEGMKHLTQCCSEMEKMEENCRCEMLEQIMKDSKGKMETIMETARVLPKMCGVGPEVCEFSMTKI